MRVCRFRSNGREQLGFYNEQQVTSLAAAFEAFAKQTGESIAEPAEDLLSVLPNGSQHEVAQRVSTWLSEGATVEGVATAEAELLVPIPRPNKLFLLAGNYAKHIEEGGGVAAERAETFPYVFMKPPTTTLTDPGKPITVPAVSPDHVDWELELAVVIGRHAKGVSEADALNYVAGFTIINDISNRKFRPNPDRKERDRDKFFDWLHGKWHDSFCPCGPCVATLDAVGDPQDLAMTLSVDGQVKQDASTAQQIFPVAAVIEFISSFVTLEPGDIISTGTPAGVGNTTGDFLKAGAQMEASIASIGVLKTPVKAE